MEPRACTGTLFGYIARVDQPYTLSSQGGGYVVSGGVARTLVEINHRMRLKFTPIEDATLGFWLMAMDLRHIDHRRFHTWAVPCCFKPPVRREGMGGIG